MKNFLIFFLCVSFIFASGCSFFKTSVDSTEIEEEYEDEEEQKGDEESVEQYENEDEQQSSEEEGDESSDVVLIDEEDLPPEDSGEEVGEFSEEGDGFVAGFDDVDEEDVVEDSESVVPVTDSNASSTASPVAKKTWIPLKKIKTGTYNKAGFLVNAVYIARPQETIEGISQKIFNTDNTQHLYAINSHLRNRNVKVGDKIYYNSPRRSNDNSQILVYFEDIGIAPKEHFAQAGENIRAISSNLLGHQDSWKEIWATNQNINSKGILNQSVSIKYWTEEEVASIKSTESEPIPSAEEEDSTSSEPTNEEVSQQEDSSIEDGENFADGGDESSESEVAPGVISENEPPQSSGIVGLVKKDGILATAVIAALIGLIFIPAILKRRKKKEYDFTAANFEVD